ncbi:hypothetical protein [Actinomadura sp. BRA 177]|uniref:hypothetical protein n=1 Tax=Actinomadura sp. BRA 177 TaxID=2745202 RepID=UPI001594E9DB|nr:hypothetical protein [Actinomadura sp. BRA 177]NVI89181.1 hypothetical protein [Actinomadura sp. BRA 177]
MTNFPKWSEVRADVVAAAGGEEAVAEAHRRNQSYIDGHRKALGLSQTAGGGSSCGGEEFRLRRAGVPLTDGDPEPQTEGMPEPV